MATKSPSFRRSPMLWTPPSHTKVFCPSWLPCGECIPECTTMSRSDLSLKATIKYVEMLQFVVPIHNHRAFGGVSYLPILVICVNYMYLGYITEVMLIPSESMWLWALSWYDYSIHSQSESFTFLYFQYSNYENILLSTCCSTVAQYKK